MKFRTPIPVKSHNQPIDYQSKLLTLGSCFAANMGEKLNFFKFQNTTNPFGIIFNPASIERLIKRIVEKNHFTEEDLFFFNERWHCYDIHSELSLPDQESYKDKLNQIIELMHHNITQATHIIFTYGTAWVYREQKFDQIVANCHKVPQNHFQKELLTIESIEKSIENTLQYIHQLNPSCQSIFTISPVRHIKDGFVENQISKSHLISALHNSLNKCLSSSYFPSYEIMMDELRDYRFYAEDMLHPNQTAIDYIWSIFTESHISQDVFSTMKTIENIQKSLQHKPFNKDGDEYNKFLSQLENKMQRVKDSYPHISF